MANSSHGPEIGPELTCRVASLARVRLTDEETKTFTAQIADVLKYVAQLVEVGTEGVEPLLHPLEPTAALRPDEARPSPRDEDGKPKTLRAAPEVFQDGFKVPPIL
jgi:aspartyl-tRNA(Asn)/glutamyl-tRNA(Gln) amidotransferase subunit C